MDAKKSIIMVIVLVVAIITVGVWSSKSLANTSNEFDKELNILEESIKEKNWTEASDSVARFQDNWKKAIKTWSVLLDHFEIDNIESSLSKVEKFVEEKEDDEALVEIAVLRLYVKHIPDNEALSLKNIL